MQILDPTFLFSNAFAITSNSVTAMLCTAIALLLVSQLYRDKKSRSLLWLMLNLSMIGLSVVVLRVMSVFGEDIHDVFDIATILTATVPCRLFIFATDYLDLWTRWRRYFLRLMVFVVALVSVVLVIEAITDQSLIVMRDSTRIAPDGAILYKHGPLFPLSLVVIIVDEAAVIITLITVFRQWKRQTDARSKRVLVGIGVLAAGMTLIPVPGIEHYAFEQIFYSVGSVLLVVPILGQRLFDPISQLNRKLAFRAEQLALNNRLGLLANSTLSLKELLPSVAYAVRESFNCDGVVVTIANSDGSTLAYAANYDGEESTVAPNTDKNYSANFDSIIVNPFVLSTVKSSAPLTGSLELLDRSKHRFDSPDVQTAIRELSEQIAVAIRNALLFDQVQRANTAKSNFVNHISHELRNGLNNILQSLELTLRFPNAFGGIPLPQPYFHKLQKAEQDGKFIKALLTDVLDLAKIEAGKISIQPEPFPLNALLIEIEQGVIYGLNEGISFEIVCDGSPCVYADRLRVRQILRNLVENAAKFTTAGSIRVSTNVNGKRVYLSVSDTGRGMTPDEVKTLFQDFQQASPEIYQKYGGTGIGLSLSRELARLHGGDLMVESELGKGSTFKFSLQCCPVTHRIEQTKIAGRSP